MSTAGPRHGQMAEYGEIPMGDFSQTTRLAVATVGHREYRLSHHTSGWECAGSKVRYASSPFWSVLFDQDNAIQGRLFLSLDQAQALFDKWSKEAV